MHILVGVWHPAHVHFFRNAIKKLKEGGHRVTVAARKKESTYKLLRSYNIDFIPISSHKKSPVGKFNDFLFDGKERIIFATKSNQIF